MNVVPVFNTLNDNKQNKGVLTGGQGPLSPRVAAGGTAGLDCCIHLPPLLLLLGSVYKQHAVSQILFTVKGCFFLYV